MAIVSHNYQDGKTGDQLTYVKTKGILVHPRTPFFHLLVGQRNKTSAEKSDGSSLSRG